jgi:tetratricopeptide (TPR) repeat protein
MRWIVSRGPLQLGYRMLVEAITRAGAQERDLPRCRALCAAGELAFLTGLYGKAKEHIEESLAIARDIGDQARVAEALRLLGYVALAHGEHVEALRQFESALALSRDVGDKSLLAAALNGLAELHRTQGELHKARMLYEEALALDREVGDRRRLAVHLCNLAGVLIESEMGESHFEVLLEALTIAEEIGSKQVGRAVLEYSAGLCALHQEWELAARLHGAAEMQAEQMGYHREPMDKAFLPPLMARVREALGAAAYTSSDAAGRKLAYEQAMADARAWLESAQRVVGNDPMPATMRGMTDAPR